MQGQLQTVLNQRLYFILLLTSKQKCRFCCLVVKKIPNCFIAKTHNVKTKKNQTTPHINFDDVMLLRLSVKMSHRGIKSRSTLFTKVQVLGHADARLQDTLMTPTYSANSF